MTPSSPATSLNVTRRSPCSYFRAGLLLKPRMPPPPKIEFCDRRSMKKIAYHHQQRQADHRKQVEEVHGIGRRRDLVFVLQLLEDQIVQLLAGRNDRKRGRELLVQLDRLSLAVGLARGVRGRIGEFAGNLHSLEVNVGNIVRFELLAEEPVTDLRGAIEHRAEDHEQDHDHDDGDNKSGRDAAAGGGGIFAGGVLGSGGEGVSGGMDM